MHRSHRDLHLAGPCVDMLDVATDAIAALETLSIRHIVVHDGFRAGRAVAWIRNPPELNRPMSARNTNWPAWPSTTQTARPAAMK